MRQMAQKQVEEGLRSEGIDPSQTMRPPEKTPIAAGIDQAMQPQQGLIGGQMGGA
jgi:hypothetical protein